MNLKETWKIFDLGIDMPRTYGCDKLCEDENGLTLIFVCDRDKRVKVVFDRVVYSFRSSIESVFFSTLFYLRDNYEKSFYEDEWIYEVTNSGYLKWIKEESGDLYTKNNVRHFVFYTPQEVIEVLTSFPPEIVIED